MDSIRKWFYRPKKEDKSLLAQFFYADESLNGVACELDSFDGRQEPERCSSLVNQLRHCQDKVLSICNQIMDELIPEGRANRDFRVKFPDDVMQENLAGQLWFGAECLAAGSSILNREAESSAMRPLAKALTKSLEIVRNLLREQALRGGGAGGQTSLRALGESCEQQQQLQAEKLVESLKIFDRLFADFELCYVGAMVPVKSTREYEQQELVCVLFSETLQRALERGLLAQVDVDNYEPALMFTIPRLAIVAGLLAPPGGPLCLENHDNISEMFRPFRTLLLKIRELLWTLNNRELYMLEKLLCSIEEPASSIGSCQQQQQQQPHHDPDLDEFVSNFYTGYPNCKDFIADFYTVTRNTGSNMDEVANDAVLSLDQHLANPQEATVDAATASSSSSSSSFSSSTAQCPTQQAPNTRHDSSGSSDFYSCDSVSVEIPAQYLLNQVSHESAGTPGETIQIQQSLANDVDAAKLITEANKSLSNLLLEADCQNDVSEQTDSGLCTTMSSENTSLYDKSPEEKKSYSSGIEQPQQQQEEDTDRNREQEDVQVQEAQRQPREDEQENTSYSCSNLNSPKRRNSSQSDNSACVCRSRGSKASAYLQPSLDGSSKASALSSNLHSSNEEIIGIAYGSGQLAVCDANQPSFQINYSENWENLNLNIEASSSRREFWSELKCDKCPPASSSHVKPQSSRKRKEDKQRRKSYRRKYEAAAKETLALVQQQKHKHHHHHNYQHHHHHHHHHHRQQQQQQPQPQHLHGDASKRRLGYQPSGQLPTSTESSRSNSTDRCLNPRLVNFGASLHPSQNTRQMPNFGACSPHASPRMQHFEPRANSSVRRQAHAHAHNSVAHSRKLLEHRRSRSEQLQRLKKRDSLKRKVDLKSEQLKNDGLGPRTNKSGVAGQSPASPPPDQPKPKLQISGSDAAGCQPEASSGSSCSSCYDTSSETSEFQSDCQDDEEIALAMQAAEIANRNQIRAKFRSSEDLVHRLFVCIAGVADQLQTNFASDLRNILKCVFLMNSTQSTSDDAEGAGSAQNCQDSQPGPAAVADTRETPERGDSSENEPQPTNEQGALPQRSSPVTERGEECVERAPVWVPDSVAPRCMACQAGFTVVRRRHHCRNCGQVFCGRCSSNNVPLPRYGHTKPVRVCNRCYLYQVTPFTVSSQIAAAAAAAASTS